MKDTCAAVSLLSWSVVPALSLCVYICPNEEGSASQMHLILDSRMYGTVTARELTADNGNQWQFQMFFVPVFKVNLLVCILLPQLDLSYLLVTCPKFVDWTPFFIQYIF